MKLLDQYLDLQEQIYTYFGYTEDWHVYPIDDNRDCEWKIEGNQLNLYARSDSDDDEVGDEQYENPILPNGSFPSIYRAEDYTMVLIDTECDGNKFLVILDNKKELK